MCVHLHTWCDMYVLELGGECDGKTFHNFVYYIFDCWFITWIESSQYISVHVWYKQVALDVKHSALHACMGYVHVQVIGLAKQETHRAVHRRFSSKKSTNTNAWLSPLIFVDFHTTELLHLYIGSPSLSLFHSRTYIQPRLVTTHILTCKSSHGSKVLLQCKLFSFMVLVAANYPTVCSHVCLCIQSLEARQTQLETRWPQANTTPQVYPSVCVLLWWGSQLYAWSTWAVVPTNWCQTTSTNRRWG